MTGDLTDLRREAIELTQEFTAITLLTHAIDKGALARLAADETKVMTATSRRVLRAYITIRRKDVALWRDEKEVRASRQELIEILGVLRATPPGKLCFVRKAHLARLIGWCEHYPRPAHCQIGIPKDGIDLKQWVMDFRLLEALLYEDMCALYNLALDLSKESEKATESRVRLKQAEAVKRAVVTSAFYFVESYLNGIAFDFLATANRTLSEKDLRLLTEWDTSRGEPRYARFRDKLLHYPRIVLGLEHPPLQENNCEPLAFLLEQIKVLRDAIVHASPVTLGGNEAMSAKELALFEMDPQLIDSVVDQAIALVRLLERTVRGHDNFLDWLVERNHGRFPEAAFA